MRKSSRATGSQYDTLGLVLALRRPAAVISAVAAVPSGACRCHSAGLFASVGMATRALMPLSTQLPDHIEECFLDVHAVLCRRLNEITAQVFGQSLALLRGYFTLGDAIAFVAYEHDRCLAENRGGCADGRAGIGGGSSHGRLFNALNLAVEALYACKRGS